MMRHSTFRWLWPKHLLGKLAVLVVGFFLTLAGLYGVALFMAARRLEAAWKRSDALGWPRTLEAFLGPEIPDEENATVAYDRAATIALQFAQTLQHDGANALDYLMRGGRRADFLARVVEIVRARPEFAAALEAADKLPNARSKFEFKDDFWDAFLGWSERRFIFVAELAVSRELESAGRFAEAVRRLVRVVRLGRRWIDVDPFMFNPMYTRSVDYMTFRELARLLELYSLPPDVHDEIDRMSRSFESIHSAYARTVHSEKMLVAEWERRVGASERKPYIAARAFFDLVYATENLQRAAESYRLPLSDAMQSFEEFDSNAQLRRRWPLNIGASPYTESRPGSMAQYRHIADMELTQARALRAWNAMARRGERTLESARQIVAELDLRDPFDEAPLRVVENARGIVIYSVGPNLVDNRGREPHDVCLIPALKYCEPD